MKKMDEGYIKFELEWTKQPNDFKLDISELIKWRNKLKGLDMIGYYPGADVAFGNISIRESRRSFIISATQTGQVVEATEEDFCTVTDYNIEKNSVKCIGPQKASSESMTHAAIYECDSSVNAVIHVHHQDMWMSMLNKVPTSRKNVAYGTPEMAKEIKRLFDEEELGEEKLMAMSGHEDGIIAFGKDLDEAAEILLEWEEKGNY